MEAAKIFLLEVRKAAYLTLAWVAAVFLHNIISGLMGREEWVFFLIAVFVIPFYLTLILIYTLIHYIFILVQRRGKKWQN